MDSSILKMLRIIATSLITLSCLCETHRHSTIFSVLPLTILFPIATLKNVQSLKICLETFFVKTATLQIQLSVVAQPSLTECAGSFVRCKFFFSRVRKTYRNIREKKYRQFLLLVDVRENWLYRHLAWCFLTAADDIFRFPRATKTHKLLAFLADQKKLILCARIYVWVAKKHKQSHDEEEIF